MKNKEQQVGRSLLEMLMVLGLIGLLTIAVLPMFENSRDGWQAQMLVKEVLSRASYIQNALIQDVKTGRKIDVASFPETHPRISFIKLEESIISSENADWAFQISADGVSKKICERLKTMDKSVFFAVENGGEDFDSETECTDGMKIDFIFAGREGSDTTPVPTVACVDGVVSQCRECVNGEWTTPWPIVTPNVTDIENHTSYYTIDDKGCGVNVSCPVMVSPLCESTGGTPMYNRDEYNRCYTGCQCLKYGMTDNGDGCSCVGGRILKDGECICSGGKIFESRTTVACCAKPQNCEDFTEGGKKWKLVKIDPATGCGVCYADTPSQSEACQKDQCIVEDDTVKTLNGVTCEYSKYECGENFVPQTPDPEDKPDSDYDDRPCECVCPEEARRECTGLAKWSMEECNCVCDTESAEVIAAIENCGEIGFNTETCSCMSNSCSLNCSYANSHASNPSDPDCYCICDSGYENFWGRADRPSGGAGEWSQSCCPTDKLVYPRNLKVTKGGNSGVYSKADPAEYLNPKNCRCSDDYLVSTSVSRWENPYETYHESQVQCCDLDMFYLNENYKFENTEYYKPGFPDEEDEGFYNYVANPMFDEEIGCDYGAVISGTETSGGKKRIWGCAPMDVTNKEVVFREWADGYGCSSCVPLDELAKLYQTDTDSSNDEYLPEGSFSTWKCASGYRASIDPDTGCTIGCINTDNLCDNGGTVPPDLPTELQKEGTCSSGITFGDGRYCCPDGTVLIDSNGVEANSVNGAYCCPTSLCENGKCCVKTINISQKETKDYIDPNLVHDAIDLERLCNTKDCRDRLGDDDLYICQCKNIPTEGFVPIDANADGCIDTDVPTNVSALDDPSLISKFGATTPGNCRLDLAVGSLGKTGGMVGSEKYHTCCNAFNGAVVDNGTRYCCPVGSRAIDEDGRIAYKSNLTEVIGKYCCAEEKVNATGDIANQTGCLDENGDIDMRYTVPHLDEKEKLCVSDSDCLYYGTIMQPGKLYCNKKTNLCSTDTEVGSCNSDSDCVSDSSGCAVCINSTCVDRDYLCPTNKPYCENGTCNECYSVDYLEVPYSAQTNPYINTGIKTNWDNDITVSGTFAITNLGARHMIVGNHADPGGFKELGVEVDVNNKSRLYIQQGLVDTRLSTIKKEEKVDFLFDWGAYDKKYKMTTIPQTGAMGTTEGTINISGSSTYPLYLFRDQRTEKIFFDMRIYNLKIKNPDLVRDFVPKVCSGKPCMWDNVTKQCFYANGNTALTATADDFVIPETPKKTQLSQYTPLEYIESSGTQYIDTGVIPNSKTGIEIKAVQTKDTDTAQILIGSRKGDDRFWINFETQGYNGGMVQGSLGTFTNLKLLPIGTMATIKFNYNGSSSLNLNGTDYSVSNTFAGSNNLPMYIFRANWDVSSFNGYYKLYYVKIYDGTRLVRDMVPVLDNRGVPCLFDKVEQVCHYNKGTGEFNWKCGAEKPFRQGNTCMAYKQIDYIESSGTQYIDTLYFPNPNTEIKMDLQFLGDFNPTSSGAFLGCTDDIYTYYTFNFGAAATQYNQIFCWPNSTLDGGAVVKNFVVSKPTERQEFHITPTNANMSLGGGITFNAKTSSHTTNSLYLFAMNGYNGLILFKSYSNMRLYSMQIMENGTLIRDYIPVLAEGNEPCLFDKVEGRLHCNKGTGWFNAPQPNDCADNEIFVDGECRVLRCDYSSTNSSNRELYTCYLDNQRCGTGCDADGKNCTDGLCINHCGDKRATPRYNATDNIYRCETETSEFGPAYYCRPYSSTTAHCYWMTDKTMCGHACNHAGTSCTYGECWNDTCADGWFKSMMGCCKEGVGCCVRRSSGAHYCTSLQDTYADLDNMSCAYNCSVDFQNCAGNICNSCPSGWTWEKTDKGVIRCVGDEFWCRVLSGTSIACYFNDTTTMCGGGCTMNEDGTLKCSYAYNGGCV